MSLGAVLAMSGRPAQASACYEKVLSLDSAPKRRKAEALAALGRSQ
jgi:predicted TPR repeat methyltransferase